MLRLDFSNSPLSATLFNKILNTSWWNLLEQEIFQQKGPFMNGWSKIVRRMKRNE